MSKAEKRIPVTEDTQEALYQMKGPSQTYDELLTELVQERNRRELKARFRELEETDTDELTSLEDA